jgi:flagellin-specific chaperone FliS
MSKVNDYNEKCLDELFTELDEQEERKQMTYDKAIQALEIAKEYLKEQAQNGFKAYMVLKKIEELLESDSSTTNGESIE